MSGLSSPPKRSARAAKNGDRDYTEVMTSRIEKIETEVMQLSAKELDAFRAWFADYNDA